MLLIYQIKMGLCLIALYLLWKLLFSRETFHRFNRVALLTVMVLALVLPLIRLSLDTPALVDRRQCSRHGSGAHVVLAQPLEPAPVR